MIRTRDILGQGHQHKRVVFNCFVIGSNGVGKSAFLDAIINKSDIENNDIQLAARKQIDFVQRIDDQNFKSRQLENPIAPKRKSVIQVYRKGVNRGGLRNLAVGQGEDLKFIIFTEIPAE